MPTLIKLASGYEAATQVRAKNLPTFAATVPFKNIQGTTLTTPFLRALASSEAVAWFGRIDARGQSTTISSRLHRASSTADSVV